MKRRSDRAIGERVADQRNKRTEQTMFKAWLRRYDRLVNAEKYLAPDPEG